MIEPSGPQLVATLWSFCRALRDESLEDSANLPAPEVIAEEIADDLRSALEQIEAVLGDLRRRAT